MSDLLPVDLQPVGPPSQYTSDGVARPEILRPAVERGGDSVELSPEARRFLDLASQSTVRSDLVDLVRTRIDAGTYETDDKIDITIDRLVEDL